MLWLIYLCIGHCLSTEFLYMAITAAAVVVRGSSVCAVKAVNREEVLQTEGGDGGGSHHLIRSATLLNIMCCYLCIVKKLDMGYYTCIIQPTRLNFSRLNAVISCDSMLWLEEESNTDIGLHLYLLWLLCIMMS